jgi:hypothetical protein
MSMFIVIVLFVLTNVAYFSVLSFEEITQAATVAIVSKNFNSHHSPDRNDLMSFADV